MANNRFLFGDSSAFPYDFNFLATIEAFMTAATRVVLLEHETKRQAEAAAAGETTRAAQLTSMKGLHQRLMLALERATNDDTYHDARAYTDEVSEAAKRILDRHHRNARDEHETEVNALESDRERRAAEARKHLEEFFLRATLPIDAWRLALELSDANKESTNTLGATIAHPGRIISIVATEAPPNWLVPRKVSEFCTEVVLMVGVKKSFFKGTVSAEELKVDDYYIGAADLSEDQARFSLRKKLDQKDSLVFSLRRSEGGVLSGNVDHPGDSNAAQLPTALSPADLSKLDALWQTMRKEALVLLERRTKLVGLRLDDQDVLGGHLALPLVVRWVDTFAPLCRQIAERSPNDHELTLKMETEGGRREEIYLRRDELLSKMQPLSADGRAVFGPVGLDDWMPTLTLIPPDVSEDVAE